MKLKEALIFISLYFIVLVNPTLWARSSEDLPLADGWNFHPGDLPGAEGKACPDGDWRPVRLPHDWSIEEAPRADAPSAGGGGFFPTGIGWYRLNLEAPMSWSGKQVFLHLEGGFRETTVWINGQLAGQQANGYLPLRVGLTPHLRLGEPNSLAIRVDNARQPNSRWYTGSGLYRPARLEVRHPLHVVPDGIWVHTTDLHPRVATVAVEAEVANQSDIGASVQVDFTLISPDGLPVRSYSLEASLNPRESATFSPNLAISDPLLWSPDRPDLYRCVVRVWNEGLMTDRREVPFGIRTLNISAREGLLLNGQPVDLVGGNLHHDTGILGARAYPDAEARKVRLLKEAGFNAVRTAHNPPSPAFLDACDRQGLLVIAEAFDGWRSAKLNEDYSRDFDNHWRADLDAFIRRDRNHPSVILWSLGNEMYERGKASGVEIARAMREQVRRLDPTRPVTAGVNGLGQSGQWADLDELFAQFDVAGYNYELPAQARADLQRVPDRIFYSAESFHGEVFENWRLTRAHPAILGDFVWSAMDYLGEAGIGRVFGPTEPARAHWEGSHFPSHGALCGDMDLIGTRRPHSYYRQLVWDRGCTLTLAVRPPDPAEGPWQVTDWAPPFLRESWTWPGHEGRALTVEVAARHPLVRLYSGRTLVGEAEVSEESAFKAVFTVPYSPGILRAEALRNGQVVETREIHTAGPPRRLLLAADRERVHPNGEDLIFVEVVIADAAGQRCPEASLPVRYTLEGPGKILSIGSADLRSTESYGANPRRTYRGRALVVIQAGDEAGTLLLRAEVEGLIEGAVAVSSAYPL